MSTRTADPADVIALAGHELLTELAALLERYPDLRAAPEQVAGLLDDLTVLLRRTRGRVTRAVKRAVEPVAPKLPAVAAKVQPAPTVPAAQTQAPRVVASVERTPVAVPARPASSTPPATAVRPPVSAPPAADSTPSRWRRWLLLVLALLLLVLLGGSQTPASRSVASAERVYLPSSPALSLPAGPTVVRPARDAGAATCRTVIAIDRPSEGTTGTARTATWRCAYPAKVIPIKSN